MEIDDERGKHSADPLENHLENGLPENCSRDADSHVEVSHEMNNCGSNDDNDSDNMVIDHEALSPYKEPLCVDHLERLHEEILNPLNNHTFTSENQDDETLFTCRHSQCEFSTIDAEEYLKHEYEHIDGKSYQCDVCHTNFTHFLTMRHHRMTHLIHRPYDCRLCSKTFTRQDCLLEHIVKQHSKQRPYHCPFCARHFKLRPLLRLHLSREHCAALLIKTCKLCGFKATSPNSSRRHFSICYHNNSRHMMQRKELDISSIPVGSEVNAIVDLGAISQNFSFAPPHYTPFTVVSGESSHSVAGPSEVVSEVPLHTTTPALNFSAESFQHEQRSVNGSINLSPVTSSASSTTVISPSANSSEGPQNLAMNNIRILVKSEPSEPTDDSQNGSALPTSTMDLSATSVVETSYVNRDCQESSPDVPIGLKVSCFSQNTEKLHPQLMGKSQISTKRHSQINTLDASGSANCCCYYNPDSKRSQPWKKRETATETSNLCSYAAHYHCTSESQETQTDLPTENRHSSRTAVSCSSCQCHQTPLSTQQSNTVDCKSRIVMEKNLFSCPYCEIMFPDQILYFLHRSLHSETHPWKCNLCGKIFNDRYDFNAHIIGQGHH